MGGEGRGRRAAGAAAGKNHAGLSVCDRLPMATHRRANVLLPLGVGVMLSSAGRPTLVPWLINRAVRWGLGIVLSAAVSPSAASSTPFVKPVHIATKRSSTIPSSAKRGPVQAVVTTWTGCVPWANASRSQWVTNSAVEGVPFLETTADSEANRQVPINATTSGDPSGWCRPSGRSVIVGALIDGLKASLSCSPNHHAQETDSRTRCWPEATSRRPSDSNHTAAGCHVSLTTLAASAPRRGHPSQSTWPIGRPGAITGQVLRCWGRCGGVDAWSASRRHDGARTTHGPATWRPDPLGSDRIERATANPVAGHGFRSGGSADHQRGRDPDNPVSAALRRAP